MKVPSSLSDAFQEDFQKRIGEFATAQDLLESTEDLSSRRFLTRSIAPHVEKLSTLFNRKAGEIEHYWKQSSNPRNLKLAYFLSFMPPNLFRVASVWSELSRLGFRFQGIDGSTTIHAVEFGAGPASGAAGIAAGERYASVGLPETVEWSLIDQNRSMLELGRDWLIDYAKGLGHSRWKARAEHRKWEAGNPLLPRKGVQTQLWVMSYFLNELQLPPQEIARLLLSAMEQRLVEEGVVVIVEPALKAESRKLLEIRKALIAEAIERKSTLFKILLPCLGHQACGALAREGDWCHEEVSWWRPPYLRAIDEICKLDRKTLPFSYLVLTMSRRSHAELLPALSTRGLDAYSKRLRLVSPSHLEGRDQEFFVCGEEGKRRARYRSGEKNVKLGRGDILQGADARGEPESTRIEKIDGVI